MGSEKSKPNGHIAPTAKKEKSSAYSQDASANSRISMLMIHDLLLIWLDGNIDVSKSDCQHTLTNLGQTVNIVNTFTDAERCIQFVNTVEEKKICIIISGALGLNVVSRIHDLRQVETIFIFCANKQYHEGWAKEWSKIKGIFTEIEPICLTLKYTAQQSERNAISISIMNTASDLSKKNLDQFDLPFVYIQIMKELFSTMHFGPQHFHEFVQYCRRVLADDDQQLKQVDEFEEKYHDQTPLWWYTREFFLYLMLDRALRTMNTTIIIKLGFFIADLQRQIEELHEEQFGIHGSNERFTVYRGQGMNKEKFEEITATKDELLSFNCFLSATKRRKVALKFAQQALMNPDVIGVLFVMNIDPARYTTPFVSIVKVGYFGEKEDDILFSICTVFRIGEVTLIEAGNDRLVQIELTLINDSDYGLRQLTDCIQEESLPDLKGWHRLGAVLRKMGEFRMAQQVYEILLEQELDENNKTSIYSQLGMIKQELGEYSEAIAYFEKAIEIEERHTPRNETSLSHTYNNIGMVYFRMGDYPKALISHEKALVLKEQSLPAMHPQLASSYGNIGIVYFSMGDYPKALASHDKALQIKQQSVSPTHPSLAMSYNNIGNVYFSMHEYTSALASYEKALAIRQQSLPPTHLHLASSYNNIGLVYDSMGDYPQALASHEKALDIQQNSLAATHPDLIATHNNMGVVYKNMGNYPKALACFEIAVDIAQRTLPANHPDLEKWRSNLADIQNKLH